MSKRCNERYGRGQSRRVTPGAETQRTKRAKEVYSKSLIIIETFASRAQNKDWELAGSKMGNVLGIVEEKEEEEEQVEDENYNAKAGSQFKVRKLQSSQ